MAGSFTIIPPNAGDRFSISLGGSGFDGESAGSVTATYRVAERVFLFGGYARSYGMNMIKAGISFSIP